MSHLPGTELKRSKYRVLGLIGQGQFGQVFCAIHRQSGRLVALKGLAHERFPTHKFLRELRFLLSLQHPNIVTCQALEHTATGRYLVMDYCEGGTLRNLMGEESRLTLAHSLKIVADVLAGLDHAHSRGIVHCDIKPENILMHVHSGGWTARISDFGIARLKQEIVRQNSNTGSPAYMAPERFYGQYSVASDLYSVGILLFELLAGYRPFSGTPAELMSAHLNAPLKLPDTIPSIWQPLIGQALEKLAARRFHSASEMLAAMRTTARSDPSGAWTNLPTQRLPLFFTVVDLPKSLFQAQQQEPLNQLTTALAVVQDQSATSFQLSELTEAAFAVYLASNGQLQQLAGRLFSAEKSAANKAKAIQRLSTSSEQSEQIEQLLIRPQGCFVIRQQSVQLIPLAAVGKDLTELQPVAEWNQASQVAIDATGRWLAAVSLLPAPERSTLTLQRLVKQPANRSKLALATPPIALSLDLASIESLNLLALDSRHLAIVATGRSAVLTQSRRESAFDTTIRLFTRRGNWFGSLHLAVRLGPVILTPNPYQLLATDADHAGTVLLIDLKPYRVKRLWVEIAPTFLAATDWGYILAEAAGRIVFVDHDGRQVGTINSPAPITAMTTVQRHGLLIATWNGNHGQLYSLDLRTLGLDLVF